MQTIYKNLFVYGTLRSRSNNAAYEYISSNFIVVGSAKVRGILYDMGDYPAAIKTNENRFITGELYQLKKDSTFDWTFSQLDEYEEANQEESKPSLYTRELTEVFYDDTSTLAWIYWYNQKLENQVLIPSGDYFNYKSLKKNL